jgi:carboxyl-terminal processing protease
VQELINLEQGSSLKVTIAKWLTPNGTEINDIGLEPDIKVEIPEKPEEGKDYTMEKAIEVLKGM